LIDFGLFLQTNSGYIVDCVDINKQPAFDHPLLHNHKLQVKYFTRLSFNFILLLIFSLLMFNLFVVEKTKFWKKI